MTVRKHGRWFLMCLNFTFVSWGILFLIGLTHGVFRRSLQDERSVRLIFGAASVIHFIALILVFAAFYNGVAYLLRRQFANRRARRRIEEMRGKGEEITVGVKALVYDQEYKSERKDKKVAAQAA